MIFTSADPRYAGRVDKKQGDDTIVTVERVREAIDFNAELVDESTRLWLTSEQMGFPLTLFWMQIGNAATTILNRH